MMISAFARESGLPVDTVRFYVRRGLLQPALGRKGGSRPYQIFGEADLKTARIVRMAQAQGLSLDEIGAFLAGKPADAVGDAELLAFLLQQRARLTRRVDELRGFIAYLDAKIAWMEGDRTGPQPQFPSAQGV